MSAKRYISMYTKPFEVDIRILRSRIDPIVPGDASCAFVRVCSEAWNEMKKLNASEIPSRSETIRRH
ncbi:hypothetical protein RRG08_040867 [Elysia crispata]|uniref:Uncharacterized protein n=1 Tax=Elysia crispata TaxID=231223 RepID=A0AAE1AZM6_9GAST|nr:hypothetical protein RRG08_040867 [Elysia crispata]